MEYTRLLEKNPIRELPQFLPTPESLKVVSGGAEQLFADFYWLAFVQYIGDVDRRSTDYYADAFQYTDLISKLDPTFVPVYYFAAFIIGSEQHRPEVAAELIDRGISMNQEDWNLPFIAGINQYLYAHNEMRAAKYYRAAAKFPEAPIWLNRQAEILEAKIPSKIKDINVWNSIYDSSYNGAVKQKARSKLVVLWTQVFNASPPGPLKLRALNQLNRLYEDLTSMSKVER